MTDQKSSLLLPFLISLLLHVAVFALLFAPFSPNTPKQTKANLIDNATLQQAKNSLAPPKTTAKSDARTTKTSDWQAHPSAQPTKTAHTPSRTTSVKQPITPSAADTWQTDSAPSQFTSADISHDYAAPNAQEILETQSEPTTIAPPEPKIDLAQAKNAINNRIQVIWQTYPNEPNQAISATVRLDDYGNVIGIDFRAGHQELKSAANAAIRAAAPFNELAGVQNSFNIRLVTTQEIAQ